MQRYVHLITQKEAVNFRGSVEYGYGQREERERTNGAVSYILIKNNIKL